MDIHQQRQTIDRKPRSQTDRTTDKHIASQDKRRLALSRIKRCLAPPAPKPLKARSDPGNSGKFLHHQPAIRAPSLRKAFGFRWQRRRRKSRGKTGTLHPSSSNQRSCLRKDGNAYARKPGHGGAMVVNSFDLTTQRHICHRNYSNRGTECRHSETQKQPCL